MGTPIEPRNNNLCGNDTFLRKATYQSRKALIIAPLALLLLAIPAGAHAFSISEWFAPFADAAATKATVHKPQETPALKAAVNLDPNPAKGGGDITVVGGVALASEVGPSGTMADIEEQKPSSDQISIYVVREGDSLSAIAKLFNVSVNTIVWANDLSRGNTIRPGETLVILPVSGVKHIVGKGETLASVVKKYKGSMDEVLEFNNLPAGAKLAVGDTVVIPYGVEPAVVTSSSSQIAQGSGGPSLIGYFLRPIVGGKKTQGIHGYNGIDIGASTGIPVLASAGGEVIISRSSGWNGGYGQYVVIKHPNGTQTVYGHLSQNYVSAGAVVVQGQVIGAVGNTGRSTGPHLHFEVRGAKNPF